MNYIKQVMQYLSLLLICGLSGQTASAPDTIWADCGVCVDSTIYNMLSRWDWNKEYFPVVFLYLYEQYEIESFAIIDTTTNNHIYDLLSECYGYWKNPFVKLIKGEWGEIQDDYSGYNLNCINQNHYITLNRRTPTFRGFIKWLQEKQ